ncbi:MAG: Gfo/Idh/MocA family oxidoreductase [Sedimentisphaerales bacterium]|nr:Gfo/Idh/MocA family oxidoreductase [Sedimentisphaerales bacterium]
MKTIPGLGVIGGGIWAAHHMNSTRDMEREGRAKLVAMASRTPETRDKVTKEFGIDGTTDWRKLLERDDIHAVSIVTPDHLHREMAVAAMEAGKHVIVEKPMDLTIEGCEAMIETAKKNKVLMFVDFHKRYDPAQQRARDLILKGELGTIQYGYAWMEDKIIVPRDWFPKWAENTTPFWFIGVHQADMLRWTMGSEVVKASAKGFEGKLKSLGINTLDSVHAELTFANGAVFGVDISWILPDTFEAVVNQGARFVGSEGIIELDTQDRGFRWCKGPGGTQTINVNASHTREMNPGEYYHSGYFLDTIKDFLDMVGFVVNGGSVEAIGRSYPTGIDGLEATRVAFAVQKSMEQGKEIVIKR